MIEDAHTNRSREDMTDGRPRVMSLSSTESVSKSCKVCTFANVKRKLPMGHHLKIRLVSSSEAEDDTVVNVPVLGDHEAVHASALVDAVSLGPSHRLRFLDPGFSNTAVCRSKITVSCRRGLLNRATVVQLPNRL